MQEAHPQQYRSPAGQTLIADGGRRVQKPFGPFEQFSDCVETLMAEDAELTEGEAENICGAMEENPDDFFSSLADKAQAILSNLEVTFVSGVDTPAQDSEMLLMKTVNADVEQMVNDADFERTDREFLVKQDDEARVEQKTWAPALIPGEVDKQGDVVPQKEIETAAHKFLKQYGNIDLEHELLSGKGEPIESWTIKDDRTFQKYDGSESREYPAGTWMLGVEWSDEAWKAIQDGEITGLSIFGQAAEIDPAALQEIAAGGGSNGGADAGDDAPGSPTAMTKAYTVAAKAVSADRHERVSEAVSAFLDQFNTGEGEPPFLGDLRAWVDDNSGEAVEAAADELARFRNETNAPEDALVEEFIGWMAAELEAGQGDDEEDEGEGDDGDDGDDQEMQDPAEGLEDACWEGYVAVGLKPDPNGDGMVPDCVPEDSERAQSVMADRGEVTDEQNASVKRRAVFNAASQLETTAKATADPAEAADASLDRALRKLKAVSKSLKE